MGMFDTITYTAACEQCAAALSDFQSKDGPRSLATLTPAELVQQTAKLPAHFYAMCDHCKHWNDFYVTTSLEVRVSRTSAEEIRTTAANAVGKEYLADSEEDLYSSTPDINVDLTPAR